MGISHGARCDLSRLPAIGPGGPAAVNKEPDLEAVLKVKPQVIFVTDMGPARAEGLQKKRSIPVASSPMDAPAVLTTRSMNPLLLQNYTRKPDFYRTLKAFKTGRAFVVYPYNFYTTNTECALIDAYAVGKILYPAAFADVDPTKKANEVFRFVVGKAINDRMEEDFWALGRQLVLPARRTKGLSLEKTRAGRTSSIGMKKHTLTIFYK
jgi:hypothetical protein